MRPAPARPVLLLLLASLASLAACGEARSPSPAPEAADAEPSPGRPLSGVAPAQAPPREDEGMESLEMARGEAEARYRALFRELWEERRAPAEGREPREPAAQAGLVDAWLALRQALYGVGVTEEAGEEEQAQRERALLEEAHPDLVRGLVAAEASRQRVRQLAHEAAAVMLDALAFGQERFHSEDRDQNGVQDWWTADVSGLRRLLVDGHPLALVGESLARADAAPLEGAGLFPAPAREPFAHYWFRIVRLDPEGRPYAQDTDGSGRPWRNTAGWAACAFPSKDAPPGLETWLVDQTGVRWRRDTGGAPVDRMPADPLSEGWMRFPN